jgi:hypothetical protein
MEDSEVISGAGSGLLHMLAMLTKEGRQRESALGDAEREIESEVRK